MGKVILFPGQGTQTPDMMRKVIAKFPEKEPGLERYLDFFFLDYSFLEEYSEEDLKRTDFTQLTIMLTSFFDYLVSCCEYLPAPPDFKPPLPHEDRIFVGHSLGQISAFQTACSIENYRDTVKVIKARGEAMEKCALKNKGTMSAILKLTADKVEEICKQASEETGKIVVPANYNSPLQTVISGEIEGVEKANELAKNAGGKAMPLKVAGAFHSPLMQEARDEFLDKIKDVKFDKLRNVVYSNITAEPITDDPKDYAEILADHITSPVKFSQIITNIKNTHPDLTLEDFIEMSPGSVLSGLIKKILN